MPQHTHRSASIHLIMIPLIRLPSGSIRSDMIHCSQLHPLSLEFNFTYHNTPNSRRDRSTLPPPPDLPRCTAPNHTSFHFHGLRFDRLDPNTLNYGYLRLNPARHESARLGNPSNSITPDAAPRTCNLEIIFRRLRSPVLVRVRH